MKGNHKARWAVVTVAALALLLAETGVWASNMGFKLNYPLRAAAAGVSKSGRNIVALPYNQQSNLITVAELVADIGGQAVVADVARFVEGSDTFEVHIPGNPFSPNFSLSSGEAYIVRMNSDVDYIIVGSHNPGLPIGMDAAGAGSRSGRNFFALPYHSTAAKASDLANDIGAGTVADVARFNGLSDTFTVFIPGNPFSTDFDLAPGQGYIVRMNSTVAYTPSHY